MAITAEGIDFGEPCEDVAFQHGTLVKTEDLDWEVFSRVWQLKLGRCCTHKSMNCLCL